MAYTLLIPDVNSLGQVAKIPNDFPFAGFKPTLDNVQQTHLIPILGEDLFSELVASLTGSPTPQQAELTTLCQYALANLALARYIPILDVNLTGGGVSVTKSENSLPASQFRVEQHIKQRLVDASSGFERVLSFLEANEHVFTSWSGEVKDQQVEHFVNTVEEFNSHSPIPIGQFVFWRLKPTMQKVERNHLYPALCGSFYDHIKGKISSRTDTTDLSDLLHIVQKAIVHLTMAEGMRFLGLTVDEQGIYFDYRTNSAGSSKKQEIQGDQKLERLINHYNSDGQKSLEDLALHLRTNGEEYPEYVACIASSEEDEPAVSTPPPGAFGAF